MAVMNVWGRLNNGSDLDFTCLGGDVWEVTVAFSTPDGVYVAEIWASDTANNVSYTMAVVHIITGKVTCLRFIDNSKDYLKLIENEKELLKLVKAEIEPLKLVKDKPMRLKFLGKKYSCHYLRPKPCSGGITVDNEKCIRFLLGEKGPLRFEAISDDGGDFVIDNASYVLYRYNSILEEGPMLIAGHELSFVFEPQERGYYVLEVHYTVGSYDEVQRWEINVD